MIKKLMEISVCTKTDFDQIIDGIADFWGAEKAENIKRLHNPVFFYEFGNTAYVMKEGKEVTGGVILMRYGENPLKVIEGVKKKIEELSYSSAGGASSTTSPPAPPLPFTATK